MDLALLLRRLSSRSSDCTEDEVESSEENENAMEKEEAEERFPGFCDKLLKIIPGDTRGLVYQYLGGKKTSLLSSVNKSWHEELQNSNNAWKRILKNEFGIKGDEAMNLAQTFASEYRFANCLHLNREAQFQAQVEVEAMASVVMQDRFVLVIGGFSYRTSGGTPIVEVIDVQEGTARVNSCNAATRYGHSATHLGDGRILLLGGFPWAGYAGLAPPEMIQWEESTRRVQPADINPDIQCDTRYHTANYVETNEGRFVVVFGGVRDDGSTNDVFVYNIDSDEWSQKTFECTEPSPRGGHCSTIIGDKLYIFGGIYSHQCYVRNGSATADNVWVLDCSKWEWEEIRGVPKKVVPYMGGQVTHLSGDWVLILGGNHDCRNGWTCSRFNVKTRKSVKLDKPNFSFYRDTHSMQKFNKRIIVCGGSRTSRCREPCFNLILRPDTIDMSENAV